MIHANRTPCLRQKASLAGLCKKLDMKVYTVHLRRHGLDLDRDVVLVREGFSWAATILSLFWALWHRMWLVAAGLIMIPLLLNGLNWGLGTDQQTTFALGAGFAILTGLFAHDLRRWTLERQGFAEFGVVAGEDEDQALARYLDANPDLTRGLI